MIHGCYETERDLISHGRERERGSGDFEKQNLISYERRREIVVEVKRRRIISESKKNMESSGGTFDNGGCGYELWILQVLNPQL